MLLVQKAKRHLPFEHNFARDTFLKLDLPQAFLCREVGTLQVYGARNLGKTDWALSQFFNPLYVTNRNVLLEFQAGVHDGIVFDKMRPCDVFSLHEDISAGVLPCSDAPGLEVLLLLPVAVCSSSTRD